MDKIILIGAGGHAKSVIDSIEQAGKYEIVGFSEKFKDEGIQYRGYKVICTDDELEVLYKSGVQNAFITIGYMGNSDLREKLYNKLKSIGFNIPSVVDKSAILATDVQIGKGCFIAKGTIINSQSCISDLAIINTGVVIEHECYVGFNTHIAGKSIICGNVNIGNNVFVGAGSTVIQGIKIGDSTIIGAASNILHNVGDNKKVFGVV